MKRGVHSELFCQRGHRLSEDNVYRSGRARCCKTCVLARSTEVYIGLSDAEKAARLLTQRIRHTGRSKEEYEREYAAQSGVCAICGQPESRRKGILHSDHDHETEQRRGFLCQGCNQGLGNFLDSPERLRKAADYIEFWRSREVRSPEDVVRLPHEGQGLPASGLAPKGV